MVPLVDIEVRGLSFTLSLPGLEASGLLRGGAGRGGNPGDFGGDDDGGIIEPPAAKAANEGGGASGTTLFGVTISFVSGGGSRAGFTPPRPLAWIALIVFSDRSHSLSNAAFNGSAYLTTSEESGRL